jgi:hypothetical protein
MTDLELLRQNVRDLGSPPKFSDDFLNALLSKYGGDVNLASAHIWLLYAGDASLRNFKFTVDGRTVDKTMTAEECRRQAEIFRSMALASGDVAIIEVPWTDSFDLPEEVG